MNLRSYLPVVAFTALGAGLAGCGGDSNNSACNFTEQTGCDEGLVCEQVEGGSTSCFAPVQLRGKVFALEDDAAVEGARIVAIDANGSPSSAVAISDASGAYALNVPTRRAADGTPMGQSITLRADAAGYQSFPGGIRTSLPVDTGDAETTGEGAPFVLQSAVTDIGLIRLEAGAGTSSISGAVQLPPDRAGVLVVAESGGKGYTAIADRDGSYRIFNLPAGSYQVKAYAKGVSYSPATAGLSDNFALENFDLNLDNAKAPGSVMGSVQIVNAPGGSLTSVILVVKSTFVPNLARGEAPPGLRAPDPGTAPNISGTYQIVGVPEGEYVVLAAFENDGLVRDPDTTIGGTAIQEITVTSGGITTVEGFKVTEALQVQSPGSAGPENVTAPVTLKWVDDSSEDNYIVEVFDAFGDRVWMHDEPKHSGTNPSVPYTGPLDPGMYYQFRVTSMKAGVPISRTEDLKGVFYLE